MFPYIPKSSLLHVLSGQKVGPGSSLFGTVYYDQFPLDTKTKPWERCALVECMDEHFRDLSCEEVVSYALQLRTVGDPNAEMLRTYVSRTLGLLDLNE
jgi:ABC-type multidrug transport system ATPase subunit